MYACTAHLVLITYMQALNKQIHVCLTTPNYCAKYSHYARKSTYIQKSTGEQIVAKIFVFIHDCVIIMILGVYVLLMQKLPSHHVGSH